MGHAIARLHAPCWLYPAPLKPDADEYLEVVAIPIDQAYRMAENGEIPDGKTLAALLLARPYLKTAK
jgi:ADP-ribose pyrophosphatase